MLLKLETERAEVQLQLGKEQIFLTQLQQTKVQMEKQLKAGMERGGTVNDLFCYLTLEHSKECKMFIYNIPILDILHMILDSI